MKILRLMLIPLFFSIMSGCSSDSPDLHTTTKLTVATTGTLPAGAAISGTAMTILLPVGVVPVLDTSGNVDINRLVTASGMTQAGGLVATVIYQAATTVKPALLTIAMASKAKDGFNLGEFMTLSLSRTVPVSPAINDFTISDFTAADLSGNQIVGLQAIITAVRNE